MDFFESQEKARRRTKWLIVYFALAVAGIIAALHTGFCLLTGESFANLQLLAITAAGVIGAVLIGSLVKLVELSKGGRVVAEMLGGIPVNPGTANPTERRLLNVVEEMSLASGVPVPSVYILEDPAINAFAAGFGTGDAAIGVTRGCIELLTRDELQGVVAHEFSHILNGDMRLNIRLIGVLHGILFLALIGGVLVRMAAYSRPRSRNGKNEGSIVALLIAAGAILYIVGWIGVFFSKLIKAAVSRQREFLADASAVQFTRNPRGIAGALAKIESHSSRLESPRAQEASHMFFGNALKSAWFGLFATHPPIPERIAAIDPHFEAKTQPEPLPPPLPSAPKARSSSAGNIHLAAAASLLESLPPPTITASRELHSATLQAYALLLSDDPDMQHLQLDTLPTGVSPHQDLKSLHASLAPLSSSQKIALLELSIPTLRDLSKEQYLAFRKNIQSLIAADGHIHLFEYTLQKLLLRHLDTAFLNPKPPRIRHRTITPLLPDLNFLLSAIANADATQDTVALDAAFASGVKALGSTAKGFPMDRLPQVALAEFDKCLERLGSASPAVKKSIIDCCEAVAIHDGEVNDTQFEFLRAVADTLDCPMPPNLPAS